MLLATITVTEHGPGPASDVYGLVSQAHDDNIYQLFVNLRKKSLGRHGDPGNMVTSSSTALFPQHSKTAQALTKKCHPTRVLMKLASARQQRQRRRKNGLKRLNRMRTMTCKNWSTVRTSLLLSTSWMNYL
jgi:hypothetical protein